jgi:hypothetical protein
MKNPTLLLAVLLAGCAAIAPAASAPPRGGGTAPSLVLGVYDPRALAIVHYRSPAHQERVAAAVREHERAQAAGDAATAQRIEQEMEALQQRAHEQAFGGAPTPEILALIADRLPDLARAAGVDAIVARPDLAWLDADAEYVDVSIALAEALGPDEQTRRMLAEALAQPLVPMEQLRDHRD